MKKCFRFAKNFTEHVEGFLLVLLFLRYESGLTANDSKETLTFWDSTILSVLRVSDGELMKPLIGCIYLLYIFLPFYTSNRMVSSVINDKFDDW